MSTPIPTASEGSELKGSIISTGAPAAPAEAIAPEDKHIADSIVATNPLTDGGSSNKWPEGRSAPPPTLETLSPHMRKEAHAKLAAMHPSMRQAGEASVVAEVVRNNTRTTFAVIERRRPALSQ